MGARFQFYLLADSPEGQAKEAEIQGKVPSGTPTHGSIRHGFVYERVPHITLKSIANNSEIDVIWEEYQTRLEPLRNDLNATLGKNWEEWKIPRDAGEKWPNKAKELHAAWWRQRITRQKLIDVSIAAKADSEYLYDKPYDDKKKVRVAGPFTVENHHDEAYQWAERRRLEIHPKTGAAQLVEVRERVQEITVPKYVEVEQPVAKPRVFKLISEGTLLAYGVPPEWIAEVLDATEDSLLEIASHLPAEAAEALLNLATGIRPPVPEPVAAGVDPFEHPDALRRFRVMKNVEELALALD